MLFLYLFINSSLCGFGFYLQTHLVCVVPPYLTSEIIEPVTVQLLINSSNKYSEPHSFIYTPKGSHGAYGALAMATTMGTLQPHGGNAQSHVKGILIIFILLFERIEVYYLEKPKKKYTPKTVCLVCLRTI